jgi:hypothetical protein
MAIQYYRTSRLQLIFVKGGLNFSYIGIRRFVGMVALSSGFLTFKWSAKDCSMKETNQVWTNGRLKHTYSTM